MYVRSSYMRVFTVYIYNLCGICQYAFIVDINKTSGLVIREKLVLRILNINRLLSLLHQNTHIYSHISQGIYSVSLLAEAYMLVHALTCVVSDDRWMVRIVC